MNRSGVSAERRHSRALQANGARCLAEDGHPPLTSSASIGGKTEDEDDDEDELVYFTRRPGVTGGPGGKLVAWKRFAR
jgi:hypothetical protein